MSLGVDEVLATGTHGEDKSYELRVPEYERLGSRLARVHRGSVEVDADGAVVRNTRRIDAAPEHVWALLTSPAGLERWLGTVVDGELGPDAAVTIVHHTGDPATSRQHSAVTAWDPPRHLAITWEFSGEDPSTVEFTTSPVGDMCELVIVHGQLRALAEEYLAGWHAHLDVLVAEAEGFGTPALADAFTAARPA